jgi:hypothetical protein
MNKNTIDDSRNSPPQAQISSLSAIFLHRQATGLHQDVWCVKMRGEWLFWTMANAPRGRSDSRVVYDDGIETEAQIHIAENFSQPNHDCKIENMIYSEEKSLMHIY